MFISKLHDIGCLHAAFTFGQIVGDSLPLIQGLETFTLDRGKMYEHILAALTSDKDLAFFSVEPFYCSLIHLYSASVNSAIYSANRLYALHNVLSRQQCGISR